MPSFLNKLLAATGLTRRGHLLDATAAIQRALARTTASLTPRTATAGAAVPQPDGDVLDGWVREVDPAGGPGPAAAPPQAPAAFDDTTPDVVAPADTTTPAGSRFVASSFTGATGTRSFKLFDPGGHDGRALPLLVMLHGCTQDPDDFAAGTRMNELAQAQGLRVLYPAQAPRSNAHKCWNWFVPADQRRGSGEPALIAGMVRHVMRTHAVDAGRVYVAGLSAGGAMAAILAREYPDLFAAAGVHSGLPAGAAHDVASAFQAMKGGPALPSRAWTGTPAGGASPRAPIAAWPGMPGASAAAGSGDAGDAARGAPLIVFHGDVDPTVDVRNGGRVVDAALGPLPCEVVREAGVSADGRAFTRTVYRPADAPAGTPARAEHWLLHGAAHAWSGGSSEGSFADSRGPDASREMLRFFAEHSRVASAA